MSGQTPPAFTYRFGAGRAGRIIKRSGAQPLSGAVGLRATSSRLTTFDASIALALVRSNLTHMPWQRGARRSLDGEEGAVQMRWCPYTNICSTRSRLGTPRCFLSECYCLSALPLVRSQASHSIGVTTSAPTCVLPLIYGCRHRALVSGMGPGLYSFALLS